jgi:hypothetical protein
MLYPSNCANNHLLFAAIAALFWNLSAIAENSKATLPEPTPTCDSGEYRQFDFWIGKWSVTEGAQPAGQNSIEPDLKRCALFESWRAVDGSRGRSVNFYDRIRQRWHETWIDDRGGALELDGGLVGGSMVLEGERPDAKTNTSVRHRITWTPLRNGSVRQHWQMMKAETSTWETVFDGIYQRRQ